MVGPETNRIRRSHNWTAQQAQPLSNSSVWKFHMKRARADGGAVSRVGFPHRSDGNQGLLDCSLQGNFHTYLATIGKVSRHQPAETIPSRAERRWPFRPYHWLSSTFEPSIRQVAVCGFSDLSNQLESRSRLPVSEFKSSHEGHCAWGMFRI